MREKRRPLINPHNRPGDLFRPDARSLTTPDEKAESRADAASRSDRSPNQGGAGTRSTPARRARGSSSARQNDLAEDRTGPTPRTEGRSPRSLRPIKIYRSCLRFPAGSALIEMGNTKVLCSATVEETVPPWLRGSRRGWVTAEYGMLPGSVSNRAGRGTPSGRTQEIQRLIGRSLRAVVDLERLGERRIVVDCDVLDADGGTRTAAVTAAWVALREATTVLLANGKLEQDPILDQVAAVSVGLVDGELRLDLAYDEDSRADVDFNVVATGSGRLVEIQGTAERNPFTVQDSGRLVRLAMTGIRRILKIQQRSLSAKPRMAPLVG